MLISKSSDALFFWLVLNLSLMVFGTISCGRAQPKEPSVSHLAARAPSLSEAAPAAKRITTTLSEREGISRGAVEQKRIRRAQISLEVEDCERILDALTEVARANGGFVANSSVGGRDVKSGNMTLRVPADRFEVTVVEIQKLGEVERWGTSERDVTEEYYDLDARLRNAERLEGRYLDLLRKAVNVEDMLKVEVELGKVREQIETLTGRKRVLEDQIALSTIEVVFHEPYPITAEGGILKQLEEALRDSIRSFWGMVSGLIVFVGGALPFVLLLFVLWVILRKPVRRIRTRWRHRRVSS